MNQSDFIINVAISDEHELYNPFDPDGMVLNDDFLAYVLGRYGEKHIKERPVLRIISQTPIDEQKLRQALDRHLASEIQLNRKERCRDYLQQLRLLGIGLAFVAWGIYLMSRFNSVVHEVISIVGSFAVWEAASIWIVQNPRRKIRHRLLERQQQVRLIVETQPNQKT